MLTTVRHVTSHVSCDRIFNSCAVHELCPWCVLADGCPSDGAGEVGGGRECVCVWGGGEHGHRGVRWLGGVGHNYKSRQMAACKNFKCRLGFPSPRCLAVSWVNSQRRCGSSYCARLKRASHTFITETHWKSSWENPPQKTTDHSSTEGRQPLRGAAVHLCRFHSLRKGAGTWQHFHFCHWLVLYDWTVMGFGGSNPFVFTLFLF